MTAAAGVHSQASAAQILTGRAAPMAASGSGGNGSTDSGAGSSTISANDFLTLLVTEMKNQDPTAQTDPNEYINQLVSVNSLEQLIGINQTLSSALGTPAASSNPTTPAPQAAAGARAAQAPAATTNPAHAMSPARPPAPQLPVRGNLGIPAANAAADRVAHALDGHSVGRKAPIPGIR
jgi:flagellar basal-body rod modification protein FlgD